MQKRMYEAARRYRFCPTSAQRAYLAQTFGCVRVVYNKALEERERAYAETGKGLSYNATSALLTPWKWQPDYAWLRDVSSVPLQQTLRHLGTAYQRFFKDQAKHPRFKSKNRKQTAEFTKSGFRLVAGNVAGQPRVYLPKQAEPLRIRWSRPLPSKADGSISQPTSITITKDPAGRYFINFRIKIAPPAFPKTGRSVGLDFGITHAVITSEGQKTDNPRYYRRSLRCLKHEQKALSRKQPGSNNRRKQRRKVARLHGRIADMRRDWSHQLTTDLVRRFDRIAIETSVREWVCPTCGAVHDRDVNAAVNVQAAGLAVIASGDGGRPVASSDVVGVCR